MAVLPAEWRRPALFLVKRFQCESIMLACCQAQQCLVVISRTGTLRVDRQAAGKQFCYITDDESPVKQQHETSGGKSIGYYISGYLSILSKHRELKYIDKFRLSPDIKKSNKTKKPNKQL